MFDEIINGGQTPESVGVGPPKDQNDYQARVGLWQQFQQRMQNDPAFRLAVVQTGTALMQPINPGQTTAGHVGQAVNYGMNVHSLAQGSYDRQALDQRKADSEIDMRQAQAGLAREQTATEGVRRGEIAERTGLVAAQAEEARRSLTSRLELLRVQADQARTGAEFNRIRAESERLQQELTREFGRDNAQAELALNRAREATERARANAANSQSQLAMKQLELLGSGQDWTHEPPKLTDEGVHIQSSINRRTNERQTIFSFPPTDMSMALVRAKGEIKAVDDATPGQLIGFSEERLAAYSQLAGKQVKTRDEALRAIAQNIAEGKTLVQRVSSDGKVTREWTTLEQPQPAGTTTSRSKPGPVADPPSIPAAITNYMRSNPGVASDIKLSNGTTWRTDGRGNATPVSQATPAAQPATPTPQASQQRPATGGRPSTPEATPSAVELSRFAPRGAYGRFPAHPDFEQYRNMSREEQLQYLMNKWRESQGK